MSELQAEFVKKGYWVNHAHGPVMGQTITTDTRTGSIIIALLAVLTTLGMSHLWNLLTFAWHQVRATGHPKDGLFRQQQVMLRTLPTPSSMVADSIKLWFSWRNGTDAALSRTLAYTSVALLFTAASLATSTFSAYVAVGSNIEVLVSSPHCASLNWTAPFWQSYGTAVELQAESYGPICYKNGSLPGICNIYSRPNVAFTTEMVDCPFDKNICASSGVAFDSGLVDVRDAFGLNLETKDKMSYRKKTICSMLKTDGRTRIGDASNTSTVTIGRELLPGEQFIWYLYGNGQRDPSSPTFGNSLFTARLTSEIKPGSYQFQRAYSNFSEPGPFQAIPELQYTDADIALRLTRLNNIKFNKPVDDPMFSAHRAFTFLEITKGVNSTMYHTDSPGSVTGCTEQYQGEVFSLSPSEYPNANSLQLAIVALLRNAEDILNIAMPERYEAQAKYKNSIGILDELPNDQWITELRIWNAIVWAGFQIMVSDYAIGPTVRDPLSESYTVKPVNEAERSLCGMQKMRKPGAYHASNFNYFGLVFIITISMIATIVDIALLRFIAILQKIFNFRSARITRWLQDGAWQLQRHAYEAQGEGTWKNLTSEIPTTVDKTLFADLPIEYTPLVSHTDEKISQAQHIENVETTPTPPPEKQHATQLQHLERPESKPAEEGREESESAVGTEGTLPSADQAPQLLRIRDPPLPFHSLAGTKHYDRVGLDD
ncbi:hypothetical protein EJ04DRAFT_432960 [Polyplosphaeria fusca]|uniref:Uncharacterized protein n=1 Tax=Polyplosphaeria fusca TaxID=682080 RepID=A0A9P4R482_9PLEO|nr:hypothetical protein EJ04DRAFT_432960 [Polyplosphaeria fusca]